MSGHTPEEIAEAVWSTLMDAINDCPSEASHEPVKADGWSYEIQHGPEGEACYAWVYDDAGAMVATMRTHQAAFIVRAVNSHDRLVEALRAILAAGTVSVHVGYEHGSGGGNYVYADAILTDDDAFAKARAALEGL